MTEVKYFWVPEDRKVPMERKPTRIQTVLIHNQYNHMTGEFIRRVDPFDPDTVPVLYCDEDPTARPLHNHNVFYEDYVHDWNWHKGVLRYASRVREHSIWIRCEFEEEPE